MRLVLLALITAASLAAQIQVYSEFQRIDPFGNVVAVDKAERPREILSPAVARNAWSSFHVAVKAPPGSSFLFVQQNPEWVQATLYREHFVKTEAGWIPDTLEKMMENPALVQLPDQTPPIPGQTTAVYWLDIWVPGNTRVARMRLEVGLKVDTQWVVYPVELRVLEARAAEVPDKAGSVPAITARADAALLGVLRHGLCGLPETGQPAPLTVRQMIRRNARQDLALGADVQEALSQSGVDTAALCRNDPAPEWWLKVRSALQGLAGNH